MRERATLAVHGQQVRSGRDHPGFSRSSGAAANSGRKVGVSRMARGRKLERRAEKWEPVFRKNDATTKTWSGLRDSEIAQSALDRRRIGIALAALAWLAACGQPQKHNSAENEFNAWANQMEHASPNGQAAAPDFEEPANVMERVTPANTQ
jgi:hypothetical protein